jgi:hypothetical protein
MRIVVETCFNEGHIMPYHIANVCDRFDPDFYVIAEGVFPYGPENSVRDIMGFKNRWTTDGFRSKDIDLLRETVREANSKYRAEVILKEMDYGRAGTRHAYNVAFMSFLQHVEPAPGDLIFTLEPDLFFTKTQAENLIEICTRIGPGGGVNSTYCEIFESPKVVTDKGRVRRVAFRYGDGRAYAIMCRDYYTESFLRYSHMVNARLGLFHYAWMRPGWYFDMRLEQLPRKGDLTHRLRTVRDTIGAGGEDLQKKLNALSRGDLRLVVTDMKREDHPEHIWEHPNFKRYYGE